MFQRKLVVLLAAAGSLVAAQGALAAQPNDFGFDPWYVFGPSRTVDTKASPTQAASNPFGFDPYYVLGTSGKDATAKASPMQIVEQVRRAFGEQAGA